MGSGGKGTRGQEEGQQRQLRTIRRLVLLSASVYCPGEGALLYSSRCPNPLLFGLQLAKLD
jgi:hypothetical protein